MNKDTIVNNLVEKHDSVKIILSPHKNPTIIDDFEITILGISYPFFEEEFPHHVKSYNDQFKESK